MVNVLTHVLLNWSAILSQPKLNQQLSSTEFEVRLHSYMYIHHHPPPKQTQLVNLKLGRADN